MTYIQTLSSLISLGSNAFLGSWSLVKREIELEFHPNQTTNSLQTTFGDPFSVQMNAFFKNQDSVLVLKYYDNNSSPIFSSSSRGFQNPNLVSQLDIFLSFMENHPSIKVLLTTSLQSSLEFTASMLIRSENTILSDSGIVKPFELSDDAIDLLYHTSYKGNFVMLLIECKETFNFNFVIETLKLWSVLNGYIRFKARHIPSTLNEILSFIQRDNKYLELPEAYGVPWIRLPINIETEASIDLSLDGLGYNSADCYYESQEYFMNIQTSEENLISMKAEFYLQSQTVSFDRVNLKEVMDIDLFCGLHTDFDWEITESKGFHYIIPVIYYKNTPLFETETDFSSPLIILNKIFGEILQNSLIELLAKKWKLKINHNEYKKSQKRKSIARLLEIKSDVLDHETSFQIIILLNIRITEEMRDKGLEDIVYETIHPNSGEIQKELSKVLEKRLSNIIDSLYQLEVFMTKKLKSSKEIPEHYIPKMTRSLSEIIFMFKDVILADNPNIQTVIIKKVLSQQAQNKNEFQEVLKQGVYNSILKNKIENT